MKEFFATYWPWFIGAIPLILACLRIVAKRTKNTVDDEIVETAEEIYNEVKGKGEKK